MSRLSGYIITAVVLVLATGAGQAQHRQEIHNKHFFAGYPYGAPATNDFIIRDIYALSSNDSTKFADWVAYRLDTNNVSGPARPRNWAVDPWLDETETLEPDDYRGAYEALQVDRGHQAPLASFSNSPDWPETNYLSNITPQKSALNQGPWKRLEDQERKLLAVPGTVHVMTGPYYEYDEAPLPNADEPHRVPSGYWRIIVHQSDAGEINAAAFLFDQYTRRNARVIDYLITINEIEERTGLDFLWMLDDAVEESIESDRNLSWARKFFE